ncbi:MAG: hypothetical protein O3A78_02975 [Nitrospinae bacterium]|nr:hypothetical protein [Nitrospinota bacterium]MDA1108770.1 hypothetical protein [Nitrospinota bacterium]
MQINERDTALSPEKPGFILVNEEECSTVLANVAKFVQDKNISMRTKSGWNEFFENEI